MTDTKISNLIQCSAPDFAENAVMPNGSFNKIQLSTLNKNRYVVLFFYPFDFTFVCPSEIISFSNHFSDFKERNTEVLGISNDSQFVHNAWRNTPFNQGGLGSIRFPLIADVSKKIAHDYGVLLNNTITLRGTFIIDKLSIIRHVTINDLPLGRSVDETLRVLDALQYHEKNGEVCPAGWKKGSAAIPPTADGIGKYLTKFADTL